MLIKADSYSIVVQAILRNIDSTTLHYQHHMLVTHHHQCKLYSVRHQSHPMTFNYFLCTLTILGVVNKWGNTPLGDAFNLKQFEVVKFLFCEYGVDINGGL